MQLPTVWGPLMEVVRGISVEYGGPREPCRSLEQERGEVWLTAAKGWGGAGPRALLPEPRQVPVLGSPEQPPLPEGMDGTLAARR